MLVLALVLFEENSLTEASSPLIRVMNGLYILAMQCIGDTVSSKVFNW